MKVTIELNDLKKFIESLESDYDEWYGLENYITGSCIQDFLVWQGEKEFAEEFNKFLQELE